MPEKFKFNLNDRVKHPTYGEGTINQTIETSFGQRIWVKFDSGNAMWLTNQNVAPAKTEQAQ